VTILYAAESGSRAWGFASPDSDWDVRFVYARPEREYLRLDAPRDVIEWQLDSELDISGWDLQKALRLLAKSNPALFEWNASPIVYRTTAAWGDVRAHIDRCFSPRAGLHHYLSMARGNYREYLKEETVRLKKYFYVLRPILACRWILEKDAPPPMRFSELVEAELPRALRPQVTALLERKARAGELADGPRIDALNRYIEEQLVSLQGTLAQMPSEAREHWGELNDLFLDIVNAKEKPA
jgi:predicted nucleotidyltransferase